MNVEPLLNIEPVLDSALEHFAHGWHDLVVRSVVNVEDPDAFPPVVSDDLGTAGYHIAAVAKYLKQAYDMIAEYTDIML